MADTMNPIDITYCEGARLLQDSQADIGSILIQRPNGGLICQHCYLVVADANDVRAIAPDQDWSLLVSCHVQACNSLHDRRAAYSCYACLERGKMIVESSMAALKQHLNTCELIRDIKLSDQHRKLELNRPAPPASRRSGKRAEISPLSPVNTETAGARRPAGRPETASPTSARNQSTFTPMQKAQARSELPWEQANPPLPSRPKGGIPIDILPSSARRPDQPGPAGTSRTNAQDNYNIPGGFPGHNAPSDSRTSSLQDYSPTVPRRKEVRMETSGPSEPMGLPTPPSRAPPAPPVLSQPDPPPYYQGKDTGSASTPSSATTHDSFPHVDPAKIRQLVSLGIPRMDAEYLLNRTGGDVNAAAELQLSEMGSLAGPARDEGVPAGQPHFPAPQGSTPVNGRNRLSKR